jgi:hypothetical protein
VRPGPRGRGRGWRGGGSPGAGPCARVVWPLGQARARPGARGYAAWASDRASNLTPRRKNCNEVEVSGVRCSPGAGTHRTHPWGHHEPGGRRDRQRRQQQPAGRRRRRWGDPPRRRAGAGGRVPRFAGLSHGTGEDHPRVSPRGPARDPHGRPGVARRRARGGGAAGVLLPQQPGAGRARGPAIAGVPGDLLRGLWLSARARLRGRCGGAASPSELRFERGPRRAGVLRGGCVRLLSGAARRHRRGCRRGDGLRGGSGGDARGAADAARAAGRLHGRPGRRRRGRCAGGVQVAAAARPDAGDHDDRLRHPRAATRGRGRTTARSRW